MNKRLFIYILFFLSYCMIQVSPLLAWPIDTSDVENKEAIERVIAIAKDRYGGSPKSIGASTEFSSGFWQNEIILQWPPHVRHGELEFFYKVWCFDNPQGEFSCGDERKLFAQRRRTKEVFHIEDNVPLDEIVGLYEFVHNYLEDKVIINSIGYRTRLSEIGEVTVLKDTFGVYYKLAKQPEYIAGNLTIKLICLESGPCEWQVIEKQ